MIKSGEERKIVAITPHHPLCSPCNILAYVSPKSKALFSDRLKQIWLQRYTEAVQTVYKMGGRKKLYPTAEPGTGDD